MTEESKILSSEVISAALVNDIQRLEFLKASGECFRTLDCEGNSLLHRAIISDNSELFDFLITDHNLLNVKDFKGRTPLLVAIEEYNENFCLKLIKQDCDIHLKDNENNSALHYSIQCRKLTVAETLIEHGIDLNWQNNLKKTALYVACESHLVDEVFMLLFFGADPEISWKYGNNCIDLLAMHKNERIQDFFYKKLYPCYRSLKLSTIVYAMEFNLPTFSKLIENTVDVTYDWDDLEEFADRMSTFKGKYFKLFIDKFDYIVEEIIDNFHLSHFFICSESTFQYIGNYIENLYSVFSSNLAFRIVEETKQKQFAAIDHVISSFVQHSERLDTLTELVCCLLSYGIDVSIDEMNKIYLTYGYCELFKIILHMDINGNNGCFCKHLMPLMIYKPDMTIENFLIDSNCFNTFTLYDAFDYFALPELKKFGLSLDSKRIELRIQKLPIVPSLMELARNSARKHIYDVFEIKNSRGFFTIINKLGISKIFKEILTLARPLYIDR